MQYQSFQILSIQLYTSYVYRIYETSIHVLISKANIHINDLYLSLQSEPSACNLRCIATCRGIIVQGVMRDYVDLPLSMCCTQKKVGTVDGRNPKEPPGMQKKCK